MNRTTNAPSVLSTRRRSFSRRTASSNAAPANAQPSARPPSFNAPLEILRTKIIAATSWNRALLELPDGVDQLFYRENLILAGGEPVVSARK